MKFALPRLALSLAFAFAVNCKYKTSSMLITSKTLLDIMGKDCGKALAESEVHSIVPYDAKLETFNCAKDFDLLNKAAKSYKIDTNPKAMAAYLTHIKIQSKSLRVNKDHYPGRFGIGTRGMINPFHLLTFWKDPKNRNLIPTDKRNDKDFKSFLNNLVLTEQIGKMGLESSIGTKLLEPLLTGKYQFLPTCWVVSGKMKKSSCKAKGAEDADTWDKAKEFFSGCLDIEESKLQEYSKEWKKIYKNLSSGESTEENQDDEENTDASVDLGVDSEATNDVQNGNIETGKSNGKKSRDYSDQGKTTTTPTETGNDQKVTDSQENDSDANAEDQNQTESADEPATENTQSGDNVDDQTGSGNIENQTGYGNIENQTVPVDDAVTENAKSKGYKTKSLKAKEKKKGNSTSGSAPSDGEILL